MRDLSNITVIMPDPRAQEEDILKEEMRSALLGEFNGINAESIDLSLFIKEANVILDMITSHIEALKGQLTNNDNEYERVRIEEAEEIKELVMLRIDALNNRLMELGTQVAIINYFKERLNAKRSRGMSIESSLKNMEKLWADFQLVREKWHKESINGK